MHGSHTADGKRAREADSDSDASSEAHGEAPQKQMRGDAAASTGGRKKPRGGKPVGMSGYKGVMLIGKRWRAQASKGGKQHHLGCFVSPEEASVAVQHFEKTGEKKPEWSESRKVGMSGYKGATLQGNSWQA